MSEPFVSIGSRASASVPQGVSDAVWEFITSLKVVRKRNGSEQPFDGQKLHRSILGAMQEAGIKDPNVGKKIAENVVTRLTKTFDGHSVPDFADIRETVSVTLVDHNLAHVAKRYMNFRSAGAREAKRPTYGHGITVDRYFTQKGVHPYENIEWEKRDARITNEKGVTVFEQVGVEVPKTWTQSATNIVVSKYFRGKVGSPDREYSVRQLVDRVAITMADWGRNDGYFQTAEDADTFEAELTHILVNQMAAFNSPVWFNVGVAPHPQCSACFINSVQDDMRSILNLAVTEGMLFKGGSGAGTNLWRLRSRQEYLGGSNGRASGPVSFMKGLDAFAGVIKSGGKTRRAAKMVILNADHPDIMEFITCKLEEEKKAWALMDAGYDGSMDGPAYSSIYFQNANNSVRVTDEFMRAVENDGEWVTREVTTGKPSLSYKAREVMRAIADATWQCGDPGMQYDTTINKWHTSKNTDRIHASNPCVTGETLVSTSEGYRRIDALVGTTPDIVNGDGSVSKAFRVWKTGNKPVYQLKTSSGYALRLTADHRVFTENRGDVPAQDLQDGDTLVLKGVGFGTERVDEGMAEAIGLAVGDGCVSKNEKTGQEFMVITVGQGEWDMLEGVAGSMHAFKQGTAVDGRGARESRVYATQTGVRVATSQSAVVELMKRYAVLDEGSQRKRLTDATFSLDRESQAAILRGLFTADGTVANYGEKSRYVSLDSSSSELIGQVQLLLLGFGIKAKRYDDRRGEESVSMLPDGKGGMREYPVTQMHSLRISRSSRLAFQASIGFVAGSAKNDALAKLNASVGTYEDRMTDSFESLALLGEEDVYDLTEPLTNHFVANGLVVHNCSEYMFLDDTACNLASLNLMKYRKSVGGEIVFDVESFKRANEIVITAMEITVGNSSYPTPAIEQNSYDYRPLGIGYANLGALLMSRGLAYDSDTGRNLAAAISALQSGHCYFQSSKIAAQIGPFAGYKKNEVPCLEVMRMHRDASYQIPTDGVPPDLLFEARKAWDNTVNHGTTYGLRNAQISVIAPTGTIGFLMDCDTTGIEPDIALVKYKWLVGGGMMKIVNQTVPEALHRLGYGELEIRDILDHIDKTDTIENAPHLKPEHLPVFDCAFKAANGTRTIQYMGHVRMMAAVQPFISGAISKTVNLPHDATVEDIENAYMEGWKLGLKAIAIYRDGSKRQQALTTSKEKDAKKANTEGGSGLVARSSGDSQATSPQPPARDDYKPRRRRLSDERRAITHKFAVGNHEGYITVGLYDDGAPGEIFVTMAKEGSVISGLMDSFSAAISVGLQYGVPLQVLVNKFVHMRFEPSGYTTNPNIRIAKSIVDYIFRWMAMKFLSLDAQRAVGINAIEEAVAESAEGAEGPESPEGAEGKGQPNLFAAAAVRPTTNDQRPTNPDQRQTLTGTFDNHSDAPACDTCGAMMVRNAACYKCLNCGSTSGCS